MNRKFAWSMLAVVTVCLFYFFSGTLVLGAGVSGGIIQMGNLAAAPNIPPGSPAALVVQQQCGHAPDSVAYRIIRDACSHLGQPYVFGAKGPGAFDCSGLVKWSYAIGGISIPDGARSQYDHAYPVADSQALPGDLIFFADTYTTGISHVGIYLGNGVIINAANPDQGIIVVDLNTDRYWPKHYAGIRREKGVQA